MDEFDKSAVHFWQEIDGKTQAYCRIIDTPECVKIGRVIVAQSARGTGLARALMNNAIALAHSQFPTKPIYVQAQAHLQSFYASLGFNAVSDVYLEDGILHLDMVL